MVTLTDEEFEDLERRAEGWDWASDFMYDQVWDIHEVMVDEPLYIAWLKKWDHDLWEEVYGEVEDEQEESISRGI